MALLSLLAVGWLPGAVIFRLPFAERDKRAALPAEERTFWAIVLSLATSLSLVLALAALHRYSFKRLVIADLLLAAALAGVARLNLRFQGKAPWPGPAVLIPLALAILATWRFLPPSEYIIGGKDPGVYLNAGVQIAQRGTLVYHDPIVAAIPEAARDLFIPRDRNREKFLALRFMGFYVLDPDTGATVDQFPHLDPASIAIGYALDGLTGARRTFVFWGVFGVLAVYFFGARLFGRPAAAAAALLLTLNVVQLWFSRYSSADVVMQGLLFAALLANARAHVDDDAFFAPVAGVLLALLLFLRFDAIIPIATVCAGVLLGFIAGGRIRWTFVAPIAVGSLLCLWYLLGPMREYFELPKVWLSNLAAWQYAALAAAAVIVIGMAAIARRSPRVSERIVAGLPAAIAVTVGALAVYAFAFRHPGGKLTDYDAYALRTYANFYVTVPAVVAALIGYAIVARALFWRDPAFVVTFTAFAIFFFYKIRIVPEHFWYARRFVPMILPGTLLLVSAAALTGVRGRLLFTRVIRGPIGVVFLALLAVHYARASKPVAAHVEYEGIIPHIEQLAGRIGDNDLLIVESRDAASDVHVLAPPLADIYSRQVLVLSNAAPDKAQFAAFLDTARARYGRVLFLGGGGTDLLSSRWSAEPVASERFRVPEYESTPWNVYPRIPKQKDFEYTIYALGPAPPTPAPPVVDVGVNDDLNVLRFHAKEQTEGRTMRWSQKRSLVIVNPIPVGARTLVLTMSDGGRPAAAPPADVMISVRLGENERELGAVHVRGGFRDYELMIPADAAEALAASHEPVRFTLRSETWNPSRTLGNADDRELGVMLDRVAVR